MTRAPLTKSDLLPNSIDGLTRAERIILWQLYEAQKELGERNVPTATLYGRVVEHINWLARRTTRRASSANVEASL